MLAAVAAAHDEREGRHVAKEVILTPDGLQKLKDEIEQLQTVRRREVAERIAEARDFGDISENSEYDDAKNEQAMLEARIAQLEERLQAAVVIDPSDLSTDAVETGSFVTLKFATGGDTTYQIVGSPESDPDENRLSNESPIGRALLGRKKGEKVDVVTPGGAIKVEIKTIKRA
jgi:transcription elongation factor GreA